MHTLSGEVPEAKRACRSNVAGANTTGGHPSYRKARFANFSLSLRTGVVIQNDRGFF